MYSRSRVWWAIVWQDSLLSITYDRASATGMLEVSSMPPPQDIGPTSAYHAVMYQLSKVGLDIVRDRAVPMSSGEQIARITKHRDELANMLRDAAEYLRDSRKCNSSRETIEHWGLYLHSSYHMSELCRPAISPHADPELANAFKQTCIDNLVNTVEAFLGLNNIVSRVLQEVAGVYTDSGDKTTFARSSWAAVHRALGSAVMLGIIGEHTRSERAGRLLSRFINVMADITNNLDPQEISSPIQRGLAALSKLNIHDARGSQATNGIDIGFKEHDDISAIITPSASDPEERSPYSVLVRLRPPLNCLTDIR